MPGADGDDQQGQGGQRQGVPDQRAVQQGDGRGAGGEQRLVGAVGQVVAEEQQPLPAVDAIAGEEDRQAGHGRRDHHRVVEGQGVGRHVERGGRDQSGQAEAGEQVEEIAADDVAHRDVALALEGGDQRGGQLRQRAAGGDDGQADHQLGQAEGSGQGHRPVDQQV